MSQSDYIKYKKTSAILKKNKFSPILDQSTYLNNEEYYFENQSNHHITPNQLISPQCTKVYGMEINKETYSKCLLNSKKLKCPVKSNFVVHNVIGNQYNPSVKATPIHKDCIHVDENLYCNKNKYLKPITYINDIDYSVYIRVKDKTSKLNKNIRNERISFVPVFGR